MRKYIVISPWSKKLRDGSYNPKNYPYWRDVISGLEKEYDVIQIGVSGEEKLVDDFRINLPLRKIKEILLDISCHTWISVDNFLPHLAYLARKQGIVIWGISDPNIFGYSINKNLLKSRRYLRENQFGMWDGIKYNPEVFVGFREVINAVKSIK